MRNTVLLRICALPLAALLASVGCGRSEPGPSAPEPKQRVVGVSLANLDDPWHAQMKADIEAAAAKRPELRLIVLGADNKAAEQAAQLDKFFNDRVSAVVVNPVDAQAATEPVARLFDAGIPVVVLDRPVIGQKYTCLVAADPRQIGEMAGRWLAERLGGKGKIVEILGPVDSLWDAQLHDAWRAALRDPGFRFVFDGRVDPPRVDAGELMAEALADVEAIDAVIAYDDAAARAAYETAKSAGREKGVLFIGVGGLPAQGAAYVAEGVLAATFAKPTGGAQALDAAVKLLDGQATPKKISPPTRVIDRGPSP